MIAEKVCPVCKNVLSDEDLCSVCGWDKNRIFLTRAEASAWSNKESEERNEAENAEFFIETDYKLILFKNKLYGIGDNSYGQISDEYTDHFTGKHLISDNVISAVAGKKYSVYVTIDGEVKIVGRGALAVNFTGFSGASKVYTAGDDTFIIFASDGRIFAFGNNTDCQIKEKSTETVYSKYNIPFCYRKDGWCSFTHVNSYEQDEANDDIIYLKNQYFSSEICGDEVYQKYKELSSSGDDCNIKWDIELKIKSRDNVEFYENQELFDHYNDGTAYNKRRYTQFKGESSVVAYKTNNYISNPVLLNEEKIKKLLSSLTCADISEESFTDDRDEMRLFAGKDHFLVLNKGKLYGIGINNCGQISGFANERYTNLHLMAENVISAAASSEYSIYVTKNGEVKLQGNGEYVDRFPGFKNAKQVYATIDNTFFIVDNYGMIYGFGNNCHCEIQEKKHEILQRGSKKISDLPVTHLCTHTLIDYFAGQNINDIKNAFESVVYSLKSYSEFILKYGNNNINFATNYLGASYSGSNPTVPTVVNYSISYVNNSIYQPMILTGNVQKNAILLIEKLNFQGAFTNKKDSLKKALYRESHYQGIFLNKTGRLAIYDDVDEEWHYANKDFAGALDIALITNTAGLIDKYSTDELLFIVSMNNGEIFIGCKNTLLYQSQNFFGRITEEFEYGRFKRTVKIPE